MAIAVRRIVDEDDVALVVGERIDGGARVGKIGRARSSPSRRRIERRGPDGLVRRIAQIGAHAAVPRHEARLDEARSIEDDGLAEIERRGLRVFEVSGDDERLARAFEIQRHKRLAGRDRQRFGAREGAGLLAEGERPPTRRCRRRGESLASTRPQRQPAQRLPMPGNAARANGRVDDPQGRRGRRRGA